jgi:hypothetical protein
MERSEFVALVGERGVVNFAHRVYIAHRSSGQ